MRKVLGALALLFAMVMPVMAADLGGPTVAEGPTGPLQPRWHRSGAYVGVLAGYDIQQLKAEDFKFGDGGMIGGAMVGFNVNTGQALVLGLEADFLATGISSSSTTSGFVVSGSNHFLGSVRARAGVPVGPALMYVTGGPAFTEKKAAVMSGPFVSSSRDLLVGVAFGVGMELELTRTMFVRLEAIRYKFPDVNVDGTAGTFKAGDQQDTARIGLGFKLN